MNTKNNTIEYAVAELMRTGKFKERNALLSALKAEYSPVNLVSELQRMSGLNQYDFAKQIKGTDAIQFDNREIKTIATYFPYIGWGGTERVLLALHKIWMEMGFRVIILTDVTATKDAYPLDESIERYQIDDGFYDYQARAKSFYQFINKYNIDLLVYHDWNPENMIWDELLVKLCGVAFIRHCHTVFSLEFYRPSRKMQDYCAPYLLADAVVVLSEPSREFWKYFNDNVFTVKNPFVMNIDEWCLSECNGNDIIWVARIAPEKKPEDLIPIMRAVLEEVPDAKLHIVGSNTIKAHRAPFEKALRKSGLNDNIIMHGFQNEVASYYKNASVFLMTSGFEGDPLTLQEALLSGLPIVMYELPYVTLTKNNPGIISCRQGDVNAAAKAIIDLLKNPERRKEIGRKGNRYFEQYLNYDYKGVWKTIFDSINLEKPDQHLTDQTIMMETLIKHYDNELSGESEAYPYVGRKAVRLVVKLIKVKDKIQDAIRNKALRISKADR